MSKRFLQSTSAVVALMCALQAQQVPAANDGEENWEENNGKSCEEMTEYEKEHSDQFCEDEENKEDE